MDFGEQLARWTHDIADVRVHGTTHERPIDRFAAEAPAMLSTIGHAPFGLEVSQRRVPFRLIGQPVDVRRQRGQLEMSA